jgi:hypothetical protein
VSRYVPSASRDPHRARRPRRPHCPGTARAGRTARRRLVRHLHRARTRRGRLGATHRALPPVRGCRGGRGLAGVARLANWVAVNPRSGAHVRALPVPRRPLEAHREQPVPAHRSARLATAQRRDQRGRGEVRREVRLRRRRTPRRPPRLWHDRWASAPRYRRVTWPAAGLAGIDPAERGITEVVVVENRACLPMVPASRCSTTCCAPRAGRGCPDRCWT